MTIRPHVVCVCVVAVIVQAGCEPTGSRNNETVPPPVEQRDTGVADPPVAAEPTDPIPLTEQQIQALETIKSANGRIEGDTGGLPLLIDLASDRVYADEDVVRAVLTFPGLRKLRLAVSTVPPDVVSKLATLSKLDELLLQDAAIDDDVLDKLLRSMPDLKRLTLRRLSRVTDSGVAAVVACSQLEVLALIEMNQITGATVDRLQGVSLLRSLDLRNCGQLSIADFSKLLPFDRLEDLKVGGPIVDDKVVAVIAKMPSLASLTIEDAGITAEGLRHLVSATELAGRLRAISFARCFGVTDDAVAVLGGFPQLDTVVLRDVMISGAFLKTLRASNETPRPWKTLMITQAFLTDETLVDLPEVAPGLVHLDLRGNLGVTNKSLETLKRIEPLEILRLEDTGVTQQ